MSRPLTPLRLGWLNIKRKPFRTYGLMAVVGLLTFVLFAGSVLFISMKNGMDNLEARLGADIILVPDGYDGQMEGILLRGEPSNFYFDSSVAEAAAGVEGVGKITSQFYLASLSASCCASPMPIIGFDRQTDFTVMPWISHVFDGDMPKDSLVVGCDIFVPEDTATIKLYDKEYKVAAQLDKTGSGLDNSVFTDMSTMAGMLSDAKSHGAYINQQVTHENSISSVLIKVEDGFTTAQVLRGLRKACPNAQIITVDTMVNSVGGSIGGFVGFIYIFAALFWALALVVLSIVFSVTANERKKEFALMRILGATRRRVAGVLLSEAAYISGAGALAGAALAAVAVLPFSVYIGDSLGMPYIQPNMGVTLLIFVCATALGAAVGPLASAFSALRISRAETYHTMREGE